MRRKEFDTLGDSMITALRNLREWQFISNEICSGMAPVDAIVDERKAIYKRKSAFLQEMLIDTDFVWKGLCLLSKSYTPVLLRGYKDD